MLLNLLLVLSLIALQDLAGSGYSPLGTTTAFLALVVLLLATLFYVLSA